MINSIRLILYIHRKRGNPKFQEDWQIIIHISLLRILPVAFDFNIQLRQHHKMAREFSKHLTIRVSNLPDEATESHVKIYFQRKKNGGGEVTEVRMIPNSHEALVMFEEEEGKLLILFASIRRPDHGLRRLILHVL